MSLRLIIAGVLALGVAQTYAQDIPPPPQPTVLSAEDLGTIMDAFAAFRATNTDKGIQFRIDATEQMLTETHRIDRRETPIVGMVLSRASRNPAACALMKRLEPRAMCVK